MEQGQTPTAAVAEKTCTKCGRTLPATGFHRDTKSADGLYIWCKDCVSAAYYRRKQQASGLAGENPALAAFTPRQLIDELRSRGYRGTLTYLQEIKL